MYFHRETVSSTDEFEKMSYYKFPHLADLVENCEIIETVPVNDGFISPRTGLIQTMYRWPNNLVVYNMDSPPFEQSDIDMVERALKEIEDVTCVKFVKRTVEDFYVNLTVNTQTVKSKSNTENLIFQF